MSGSAITTVSIVPASTSMRSCSTLSSPWRADIGSDIRTPSLICVDAAIARWPAGRQCDVPPSPADRPRSDWHSAEPSAHYPSDESSASIAASSSAVPCTFGPVNQLRAETSQ